MKALQFFSKYITLGANEHTSKTALKKIKLFNIFCLGWQLLSFLMIFDDINDGQSTFPRVFISLGMSSILFGIQFIHYKQHYTLARILYLLLLSSLTFLFANFLYKNNLLEFYFFLVFSKSLIFIDSKKINLIILFVAYALFYIPNLYFKHYPLEMFNDMSISFLFFSIFIIISYFKNLNATNERALEAKKNDLEQLNTFQSQFFINISHEIKTPLTLLKGQIDKLEEENTTQEDLTHIAYHLNKQVGKIQKMVDDVLDLAKMESSDFKLNRKSIAINDLVHKVYLNFESLFQQKNILFQEHLSSEIYTVKADLLFLERALNNIFLNALKYTDQQGNVSITITQEEETVLIAIKDSGIGIPQKEVSKIFNRFYQANNSINKAGGSGVGLAFSKEIIHLHDGEISVISELHKGSTFTIKLPLTQEAIETEVIADEILDTSISKHKNNTLNGHSLTLLLVDDNTEMRAYLSEIFEQHKCLEAENGLIALDLLQQERVDLVITDYMMPKMNGYDFIMQMKPLYPNIPVIMLTAKSDSQSKLDVLRLGIDDYLQKPFEKSELLIRVQNSLHNTLQRNLYNTQEALDTPVNETQEWLHNIKHYIIKNCSNPSFTQLEIAEHFNTSKSSLYRRIKSETGLSPKEFITEIRLLKARDILESKPHISLKELSFEVGFAHNSYFSNLFKSRFGVSPSNFAKVHM